MLDGRDRAAGRIAENGAEARVDDRTVPRLDGALAIDQAHVPFVLLVTVAVLAGVLSAFLVNDAICLVMAPIVLQVVRALDRNPLPYLVAVATASNCGSVATITGNPQNMVIGTLSRISYPAFAAALAPVASNSSATRLRPLSRR